MAEPGAHHLIHEELESRLLRKNGPCSTRIIYYSFRLPKLKIILRSNFIKHIFNYQNSLYQVFAL